MIAELQILSHGDDIATQQVRAMQSPTLGAIVAQRMAHFGKGHDEAADDAASYAAMLRNVEAYFLNPMRERTHGHATAAELRGAATAADKLAALCWAVADKARRHAERLAVAEADAANQED